MHVTRKAAGVTLAVAVVTAPLTNSHTPASAATLTGCDQSGGKSGEQVCATIRYRYTEGCDPVPFDVKTVRVKVVKGASNLEDKDPLRGWTFEVTDGAGDVTFARYNRNVQDDADGSVDQTWTSVAFHKQGRAHLSMGGEVNVNNGKNWTASINYDIPPKSGCLV